MGKVFSGFNLFDAHFHIVDNRFPLTPNNGYLPGPFTVEDYINRMKAYNLVGGAVVSGSFQAFDQRYLVDALKWLGPSFAGVTQLPATVTDEELIALNRAGVAAVRFNLKRGGSEDVSHLKNMAMRVFDVVGWHVELYVDADELAGLYPALLELPAVSIDHLGLARAGLPILLKLAEHGVRIKASGFGRVDFAVGAVLKELFQANPDSLMFGTDLPSTRAPRPYCDDDFALVIDTLGEQNAQKVFYQNALEFYRL